MAAFTCWCLPHLAKTSTIFILLYISLHSGFWFFHYACQIWQTFTIFQKWKPKPLMKCNKEYYKNTVQVLPYLGMLGMNDWCSQLWQHHNTIRYGMLCIHKASGDRICTLKLPKMECFSVQKSPNLATFGLAWSCQFLAVKHTSEKQYNLL